jgi:anti-sigma factor RsiW
LDNKYSDLLHQYIDGELGPLEKIILEEHLLSCPASRRELNQLKLLDWELKHQPVIELPAELASCRMTALKAHMAASTVVVKRQKSSVTKDADAA